MTANPSAATLGIVLSTVPLLVESRSGDPAAKSFVSQRLPGNRSAIAELANRKVPATIVRTSLFILTSPAHGTPQFIYHNKMAGGMNQMHGARFDSMAGWHPKFWERQNICFKPERLT